MSEIEISSGSEDSEPDISYNMDLFQQMLNLCRSNKQFPQPYIETMNKMYKKCNYKKKKSKLLCDLILKGIEKISPKNKHSFEYAASVYNELLRLSEKDSLNLQTENCVASTSNDNASMLTALENGKSNNEINESDKIFKELIEKCYQNTHFPKSNIEVIENLYTSLPSEFLSSKYFIMLLKEANEVIWPDSGSILYSHMEHIYDQLLQFKTSMKVQDGKEDKEMNQKTLKQLKKLKTALKIIRKKIKILDEKEMDINNENEFNSDSAYILKDKYEKRIVEIYKRMCKLKDEPDFLGEPILRFKSTNDSLVNKTIEKYYNLNKSFPDYFEIFTLLKCLRDKKKLKWTETELKNISHDAFLKLGKQLKLRRLNEYFGRLANINSIKDPAEENEELKKKLDESNKKLHSDLNALTQKFKNKQDYAEETEGSNLNDTECEYSSESDCTNDNKKCNKDLKPIKPILVKRKISLSSESENEPPKKSQKTIYMESFDLAPSGVTSETIQNEIREETIVKEKVPSQMTTKDNVNDKINKNNSIDLVKNVDNFSKKTNFVMSNEEKCGVNKKASNKLTVIDVDDTTNNKNKMYSKKVSVKITKSIKNTDKTLGNNNLVTKGCLDDTDADRILVIDEDIRVEDKTNGTLIKNPQEKKIKNVESEENVMNHSTITTDSENYDAIITEPEIIIHEDKEDLSKDVIEINELDDSDVEITSCETSIVPVQNKKSLESIIEAMNINKKYNWNKESKVSTPIPPPVVAKALHQNSSNLNNNLVNRWIMNNTRPPKPNSIANIPNLKHNNRHRLTTCQGLRSTSFQKSVQTARQFTQRISNTVQQQRNFNNQSVLQEQVTTMTTTTTVRQIVQKNQVHRPGNSVTNSGNKPELIELD